MSRHTVTYGEHPQQHFVHTATQVDADDVLGTVVLLHGGYWRAGFTRALMEPMAVDLCARGWHVVNVEYRRVAAGGRWPASLVDVQRAVACVAELVRRGDLPGPLILLGHSAGGQLALMTAHATEVACLAGIVVLAPVTDVLETLRTGLGDGAAEDLLADVSDAWERERVAVAASPLNALPVGVPVVMIHGRDDVRVPHEHTVRYAAAARAAGDDVRVVSPPSLEHRAAIDPDGPYWMTTVGALRELRGLRSTSP